MRVGWFNANGIKAKDIFINNFINEQDIDIFFILETWLGPNNSSIFNDSCTFINITNNSKATRIINGGRRFPGGILGIAKPSISKNIQIIQQQETHCTMVISNIRLCAIYLPPSANPEVLNKIFESLRTDADAYHSTLLFGDINGRLGELTGDTLLNVRGRQLSDLIEQDNFVVELPSNGKWTSQTPTGKGIPDVLLSNNPGFPTNYRVWEDESLGGSDHRPCVFEIASDAHLAQPAKTFERWNIKKFDSPGIRASYQEKLEKELTGKNMIANPETAWNQIRKGIEDAASLSIGRLKFNNRIALRADVWDDQLRELQANTENSINAYKDIISNISYPVPVRQAAKRHIKELQRHLRAAVNEKVKNKFEERAHTLSESGNINTLLKIIKHKSARQKRSKGGLDEKKLDSYLEHFNSTFGGIPTGTRNIPNTLPSLNTEAVNPFCEAEIRSAINALPNGKAAGPDGLLPEMFKLGGEILIQKLTTLFNLIIRDNSIPSIWCEALIVPIFKNKGHKNDIKNYRPISLTCICRRIFERALISRLEKFNDMLSITQNGFRKGRSTLHHCLTLHEVQTRFPKSHIITLDFRAAYDLVNRDVLWERLASKYTFSEEFIVLLKLLFENNSSKLMVNGTRSANIHNKRGLLQGSSLSPMLFNFFVDELLQQLNNCEIKTTINSAAFNHLAFADDIVLIAGTTEGMDQLLSLCETWSLAVGMEFAPTKCQQLVNSNNWGHENPLNNGLTRFKMYSVDIEQSASLTYLGIVYTHLGIDTNLTINSQLQKARGAIATLSQAGMNLGGFLPAANIKLYKTFIRPIFEYGIQFGLHTKKDILLLQKTQNIALRCITSSSSKISINAMHKVLCIPLMETRTAELMARFAEKVSSLDETHLIKKIWLDNSSFKSLRRRDSHHWKDQTTPLLRKQKHIQLLSKLDLNKGNVASNVAVSDNLLEFLTNPNIDKKSRIALTKWVTGGIANHQVCKKCGASLSRSHAVVCSGAEQYLQTKFESAIPMENKSIIDVIIYSLPTGTSLDKYKHICEAIYMIYTNCLGYEQARTGFWVAASQTSEPPLYQQPRPLTRSRPSRLASSGPVGRPRGRNR